MTRKELILAYSAFVIVCLLWGTTYLAIRIAVRSLPDAWLVGVRFTIAGGLMLIILLLRGEKLPPVRQWKHLVVVAVSLIGIGNWFVVWAEKFVPSGTAALMVATTPFWMASTENFIRNGERLNVKKVLGLIIGFGGVGLLVLPGIQGSWNMNYLTGIIALQIASAAWGIGSLYSKYKKVDASPFVNASMQMLMGGIFLSVIALFKGEFHSVHGDRASWLAFGYLIVFGAMIGFTCYIYALAKLPSSTVSLYSYINPIIAVYLGWLILNEEVTWVTLFATGVILSGIWLVKWNRPPDKFKGIEPGLRRRAA